MCCTRRGISQRGFTLVELLVVLVIIATLASVVAPSVMSHVSTARRSAAQSQLKVLVLALDAYRLDNFRYPTTAEGLAALRAEPTRQGGIRTWNGPYLRQAVPADPWGRPWQYAVPGSRSGDEFDLFSLGRDGILGGEGEDADVVSWAVGLAPSAQ